MYSGFKSNSLLGRFIIINGVIFLALNLLFHVLNINLIPYISVHSGMPGFFIHAWGVITYMFSHLDLSHVFYNMLWLFFMGQIFIVMIGEQRLLFTYLFGGISGAILFVIASQIFPKQDGYLIGASASVMAITVAAGTFAPNMPVSVFLIGEVKLKWVVLASFVMFSLIDLSVNTGGKISHIGGALFGFIYGKQLKNRNDIGAWFQRLINRQSLKVVHRRKFTDEDYNYAKRQEEKTLDELLDKINRSGYDSLSKREKERLHELSKK
jgi:membrane associated rhomboid family serine protease